MIKVVKNHQKLTIFTRNYEQKNYPLGEINIFDSSILSTISMERFCRFWVLIQNGQFLAIFEIIHQN